MINKRYHIDDQNCIYHKLYILHTETMLGLIVCNSSNRKNL